MTSDTFAMSAPPSSVNPSAADALIERLKTRVQNLVRSGIRVESLLPGLHLSYIERPQSVPNCFYNLSAALILQGRKRLQIGSET